MMRYDDALALAQAALIERGANDEAVDALDLLRKRVGRDEQISEGLLVEGPSANVRGRADKGIVVQYMGVQVIIAAQASTPRDKGVWVLVTANKPRDVDVRLENWEPDMVIVPAGELAVLDSAYEEATRP